MPAIDAQAEDLERIGKILRAHVPEVEVWAFGSRVSGGARPFLDLDIVLMGERALPILAIAELKEAFSASLLPFKVDVIEWAGIGDEFREIIREKYEVLEKPRVLGVRDVPDHEA